MQHIHDKDLYAEYIWKSYSITIRRCFFFLTFYFQVDSKRTQPYIYMYPLFPKLPSHPGCQDNEQISLCYIVGPCWLSILKIAVCNMLISNSLSVLSSYRRLHFLKEKILQQTLCKRHTNNQHTI